MKELLATFVLAGHLLAVNLASAGPLVCMWLHWRFARRDDAAAGRLGRRLAWASLWGLMIGSGLGLALLGLADEPYLAAVLAFPVKKFAFAAAELGCSLIWTALYAGLWQRMRRHTYWHGFLGLLTATNLLYHFPPLLAAVAVARVRPELAAGLAAGSTIDWLKQAEIASRAAHVTLASVAVAGVYLIGLAQRTSNDPAFRESAARIARGGARIALVATLFQLIVGAWLLVSLPRTAAAGLLGADSPAAGLLLASVLLTFGLLHQLAGISLGETDAGRARRSMILLTVIVVLMAAALRRSEWLAAGGIEG